jgi:hypothetical protein
MGIKLSEIEKLTERKLIIEDGKPFWQERVLRGTINFKPMSIELGDSLKNNAVSKFTKDTTDNEAAYILIPLLTDIEDDIDFERFEKIIGSGNVVAITLLDGVLDMFEEIINYSNELEKIQNKSKRINEKLPQVNPLELKKQELENLYKKFAVVNDNKERDEILKRVIELKNEIGE